MPLRQPDEKQRILDATDIVQLVEEHIALKKAGREFVGLCPFHDDHKPSMTVVPTKQIFKCFSCGAGGDALTFVMDYHGMTFPEALRFLAERAGIELAPRGRPAAPGPGIPDDVPQVDRAALVEANQNASTFFRAILRNEEHGRAARQLIERRGLSPEIVETFSLGAAPDRWDGLLATIQAKGMNTDAYLAAGLLKNRETGGSYDAFRNRLIFPIADQLGRVVAFGARRIDDADEPKYLNSSESAVFDKSRTLYALPQATDSIRKTGLAIVTEGYMDAIACHQAGVTNAVATLGTALTVDGARVLQRLCDRIVLLFDADEAGQRAADRALEVLFAFPVDVRIATPDPSLGAKDPDDLLKLENGRELFDQLIEGAVDALEFRFKRLGAQIEASPSSRQRLVDETVDRFCELGFMAMAPHRRTQIQRRLGAIAGSFEHELGEAFRRRSGRTRRQADAGVEARPQGWATRDRTLGLIGCVLHDPAILGRVTPEQARFIEPARLTPGTPGEGVARAIAGLAARSVSPGLREVLGELEDEAARRLAVDLEREVERLTGETGEAGLDAQWEQWAGILASGEARRGEDSGGDESGQDTAASLLELVQARQRAERASGLDRARVPRTIG